MKDLLIVKDVVKQYGDYTALTNANISVPKGSIYGLLGPNGAGKTTLMRIINQITAPDSGEVIFDGEPLQKHHIAEIGVDLETLRSDQAEYIGVTVEGPYKPEYYRY
ncbi:adenosylhomocysteinase [Flavobacteriales bacterium]|nr:adenosylhomocysteinase [Flavobacteriales bacterium]